MRHAITLAICLLMVPAPSGEANDALPNNNGKIFVGTPTDWEDGDSFWMGIHKVRLYGIDAPETGQTCNDGGKKPLQCGQMALDHLQSLAKEGEFRCDVVDGKGGKPKISHGRYIVSCLVNEKDVAEELVRAGMAFAVQSPEGYRYWQAECDARKNGVGVHATKFIAPWDWRRQKRGNRCDCEAEDGPAIDGLRICPPNL